jgi:hypothetical protein
LVRVFTSIVDTESLPLLVTNAVLPAQKIFVRFGHEKRPGRRE